jgi:hypothetical protein
MSRVLLDRSTMAGRYEGADRASFTGDAQHV